MSWKLFLKLFIHGERLRKIFAQLSYYLIFLHEFTEVVIVQLDDGSL